MEVSHPDRVVFPDDGITKGEVVDYYVRVADRMLPFIEGRALTVERFPQGVGGKGFMQKNAPDHYPRDLIDRYEVPKEEGGTTVYPVVHSVDAVAFFANFGVITFHVPSVQVEDETLPDWAIWDLDPPPGEAALVRESCGGDALGTGRARDPDESPDVGIQGISPSDPIGADGQHRRCGRDRPGHRGPRWPRRTLT